MFGSVTVRKRDRADCTLRANALALGGTAARPPDPNFVEATMARNSDLGEDAGDELAHESDESHLEGGRSAGGAGFVTGLLVGALVGAGLALLFAPDAGEVTRERLGRRLRDLRQEGGTRLDRAARRGRQGLRRGSRGPRQRLRDFIADSL
jgi:hypothetical protein